MHVHMYMCTCVHALFRCTVVCVWPVWLPLLTPPPPQTRLEAMQCLLQFPSGDLVTSESWTPLRVAISNALMDDDAAIAVSNCSCKKSGQTGCHLVSLVLYAAM